jgi:hypothetical protein
MFGPGAKTFGHHGLPPSVTDSRAIEALGPIGGAFTGGLYGGGTESAVLGTLLGTPSFNAILDILRRRHAASPDWTPMDRAMAHAAGATGPSTLNNYPQGAVNQ